jgi:hypothetical protein
MSSGRTFSARDHLRHRLELIAAFPELDFDESTEYLEMADSCLEDGGVEEAKIQVANMLMMQLTSGDSDLAAKYLDEAGGDSYKAYQLAKADLSQDKAFLDHVVAFFDISREQAKDLQRQMVMIHGGRNRHNETLAAELYFGLSSKKSQKYHKPQEKHNASTQYSRDGEGKDFQGAPSKVKQFVHHFQDATGSDRSIAKHYGKKHGYERIEEAIDEYCRAEAGNAAGDAAGNPAATASPVTTQGSYVQSPGSFELPLR